MSYTTLKENWNTSGSGNEVLQVYLYPNHSYEDSQCEGYLADCLAGLGERLMPDVVFGYEIQISYEHPGLSSGNDACDLLHNFQNYDDANGREDYDGTHVIVEQEHAAKGCAENPADRGAWDDNQNASLYINDSAPDKNVLIQEVGHTIINQDNPDVDAMITESEHSLGQVYTGLLGDGPVSPMATGYTDEYAWEGDCQSDAAYNYTYDQTVTECTVDALDYTATE